MAPGALEIPVILAPHPSIFRTNVESLENTIELRTRLLFKREIRDCCVRCFTEIWITPISPDPAIQPEGFSICYMDCTDRCVRGKVSAAALWSPFSRALMWWSWLISAPQTWNTLKYNAEIKKIFSGIILIIIVWNKCYLFRIKIATYFQTTYSSKFS